MPHIGMTSVIFNISTPKSSTYIVYCQVTSTELGCISMPYILKYASVCHSLATLAFRLSLDVTIIVDNTIGLTVHTTRGIRVLICNSACFRTQCVDF